MLGARCRGHRVGGIVNEAFVTLAGNLVSDVSYRVTARGDAVATFRLASTVRRHDRASGRWVDVDTCYFTVSAWRRAAENARASLAKGFPVVVHGRLRQRVADRPVPEAPGTTVAVTYTEVEATSFGLDLSRCRAHYERAPMGPQSAAPAPRVAGEPAGQADRRADAGADVVPRDPPPADEAIDATSQPRPGDGPVDGTSWGRPAGPPADAA
jgi:single-strand DNA-binding protein